MANIDELIAKIDKLVSTIEFIGNTPNGYQLDEDDIRKKFEIETEGMNKRSAEYKKRYDKMELELEMHKKNMQRIQDESLKKQEEEEKKTLENIEKRIKDHGKSKIKLLDEEYKKELQILKDAGKDTTELDKEYIDKRNEILKSGLLKGNQTVFEELNERFQKEYELYKDAEEDTYELKKAYKRKKRELFLQQSQQLVNAISNLVNAGEAQLKEIEDTWGVTNQAAHEYGRAVGYNANQIERLHNETLSWMSDNDISKQFNIGVDEMFKLMGAYNKEMGRAVALTNDSMLNLVSMKNVLGEEQALKFTANLDKFGLDVDAAKELVEGVVGDARRSGIVLNNLTQNVADNLYLAQQYTFEDGVEGLVRMAEKASAVKWNMEQTAAFAEKVSNVEGAVKTGAQLSVLGGPFAQFSNPMGMLYESLNDMEGLQDRIFAMFGNLGEWNQEKGMLDVSVFNKQRIKAASEAMGLNYSDVMNTVQSQARRNVVMGQIKNLGLGENATELVANTAQIDRETGKAYVNYDGKKIYADEINRNKDKDKILKYLEKQANSQDENLRDIAHNTLGAKELIESVEKEFISDRADFFRGIGVSKEGLAETHEKIMYVKWGLDKINTVLSVMLGLIQTIAIGRGFGGAFSGGGTSLANKSASSFARYTNVGAATTVAGKMSRGALKGIGGVARGLGSPVGMLAAYSGGYLMDRQAERLMSNGNYDDAAKVQKGSSALTGAATGAMIGGSILPGWGHLVGGVIGGAVGWLTGGGEAEESKKAEEEAKKAEEAAEFRRKMTDYFSIRGVTLNTQYSDKELKEIAKGYKNMDQTLYHNIKLMDPDLYYQIPPSKIMKNGGLLNGPSHTNGGIKVGNTGIEVEGGEYVVNKQSAMENYNLLEVINSYGSEHKLSDSNIVPTPIEKILKTEVLNSNNKQHMDFDDLTINMGGGMEISLIGGNNQYIDSKELLNNPNFISGIRDKIIKQINFTTDKAFNKEKYYKKW